MDRTWTEAELDQLKDDVIELCREYDLWCDSCIYVNGNRYMATSYDPDQVIVEEGVEPIDYFEYANPDNIFSMSFEGPLYHVINGYERCGNFMEKFDKLFSDLGLYYEQGHAWNLTCYPEP